MALSSKTFLLVLATFLLSFIYTAYGQYVEVGGKRFQIVYQNRNWFEANFDCALSGMSLAAIESEEENKALRNYLLSDDKFSSDGAWLSGHALDGGSEFTWLSTGNKLSYMNFQFGNTSTVANQCVFTNDRSKWYITDCKIQKHYICSRPLVPNCGITGRCNQSGSFY